jgi:hypothetical protein
MIAAASVLSLGAVAATEITSYRQIIIFANREIFFAKERW